MTPFELVFVVYGLLLGLAVVEVLGGFSRSLKLKRGSKPVKVGWLVPLLGTFVVLDLMSFWLVAWEAREQIRANYATLVAVLAIVGTYYMAATLIFPDEPEEWPDFDEWYDKQNRLVIGGLLAANVGSWIGQIALEIVSPLPEEEFSDASVALVAFGGLSILGLLIALLFVKGRQANVAMLAVLILLLLGVGIGEELI